MPTGGLLERFGLSDKADNQTGSLSGGQNADSHWHWRWWVDLN
jgi:hypothetical protein